jgi:hypothetical protein
MPKVIKKYGGIGDDIKKIPLRDSGFVGPRPIDLGPRQPLQLLGDMGPKMSAPGTGRDFTDLLQGKKFVVGKRTGLLRTTLEKEKPTQSLLMRALKGTGKGIAAGGSKVATTAGSIAKGSAIASIGMGSMLIMKNLIDTLAESSPDWVPQIKTDVELIPTYAQTIKPLMYQIGGPEAQLASTIQSQLKNVKVIPTSTLTKLKGQLHAAMASVKSTVFRSLFAFWLGLITAEIAGRGISGALSSDNKPRGYSLRGDEVDLYALRADELEQYFIWGKLAQSLASFGTKFKSGIGAFGQTLRKLRPAAATIGSTTNAVKPAIKETEAIGSMVKTARPKAPFWSKTVGGRYRRKRAFGKVVNTVNNVAMASMIPSFMSQMKTDKKANQQMDQWNHMVSQGNVDRTPPAWERNEYRIPLQPTQYATPRFVKQVVKMAPGSEGWTSVARRKQWAKLARRKRVGRNVRNASLAVGGTGAVGAGGVALVNKKKDYNIGPKVLWPLDLRSGGRLLAKNLARQVRNTRNMNSVSGAKDFLNKRKEVRLVLSDISAKIQANAESEKAFLKEMRRVQAENSHLRTMLTGWSEPIQPLTTASKASAEATKPASAMSAGNKLALGGGVAGATAGVGLESGRRLGKHEERQRIRKLTDMEPI